jgi:hypothetical protein
MPLRTILLTLLLSGAALCSEPDSITGWIPGGGHPEVQHRFKCFRGSLTIDWKNLYPGAVTLKANVKSQSYDGDEEVVIPPGGTASSNLETLYCSAASFRVTEKRFSMAAPPPAPVPGGKAEESKAVAPPPPPPTVAPWVPPAKFPELAPQALASIRVGMKKDEVLHRIGNPTSKLAIPEENELVETYRYAVSGGRAGAVRFSNGSVTEVVGPEP